MKIFKYLIMFCVFSCVAILSAIKAFGYVETSRILGDDRYKTSVEVSKTGWESSQNVILATGDNFPDALCAAPLAKQLGAPVLLTGKLSLNAHVEIELERLKTENVFIIGGFSAISQDIENTLKEKGIVCLRLSGTDRYETSVTIANYMLSKFKMSKEAVVVTGTDFSDAISVSTASAKRNMPVILASKDYISESAKLFFKAADINKTYVIGDEALIGEEIVKLLPSPERISGGDRYQRNTVILKRFENDMDFGTVYLTTGNDFADALSVSALAVKNNSPIVLVDRLLSDISRSFIVSKLPVIKSVFALGGNGVISDAALQGIVRESYYELAASSQKSFDEFGSYLNDYYTCVGFDKYVLRADKITVRQDDSNVNNILIYIDMYSKNHADLVNYLNADYLNSKKNIELWMQIISKAIGRQYPGKAISGELWNIESYESKPELSFDGEVEFDPSTGKWNVFQRKLSFSKAIDSDFIVTWK